MAKRRRRGGRRFREQDWERYHDQDLGAASAPRGEGEAEPVVGDPDVVPNAVLLAHSGQWAWVQYEGAEHLCRIDERAIERHSAALAAGDDVRIEFEGGEPLLKGVAPRRTKLSRLLSDGREQVAAANIDMLVIVTSAAKPRFKPGVVDRYLIAADRGGVEPLLVLNKVDLAEEEPEALSAYRDLGLPVIATSCTTGQGIDELRGFLQDKTAVLAGQSGVGKSSLINALDPRLDLEVQAVSKMTEKGRHTTRRARLYELEGNIRIIDTPGVRQIGLYGVAPEDVDLYFPEIATLAEQCRFRDCSHTQEPDCAVRAALERGELSPVRYRSYLGIRDSLKDEGY